jgi:hypothetical protein
MLKSPVDIAIICGVILVIFGPKMRRFPPWGWKPETYEKNSNSPKDPFPLKRDDLFVAREETHLK